MLYIFSRAILLFVSMVWISLYIAAADHDIDDKNAQQEEAEHSYYLEKWKESRGRMLIPKLEHFNGISVKELLNYAKENRILYYLLTFEQLRKRTLSQFANQSINSLDGVELMPNASSWLYVHFSHNCITTVAPMDKFTHVKFLSFENNKLTMFPAIFKTLQRLESLILRQNKIQTFPQDIDGFETLIKLDLSYNEIKKIPTNILGFMALCHLDLNNNEIKALPERINGLSTLQILTLNNNQMRTFIGQPQGLPMLTNIELARNVICKIAPELHIPPNLRKISLTGNHFCPIDRKHIIEQIAQRPQGHHCELINL